MNNSMKKKELHIVLSSVGGSGKTRIASQIAESRNALTVDANPSHPDISYFKGLDPLVNIKGFFDPKRFDGNNTDYVEDIMTYIMGHFKEKEQSVVIDTGSSVGISILSYIANAGDFGDFKKAYDHLGVSVFFHAVIPSVPFEAGADMVRYLSSSGLPLFSKNIIVWINSFHSKLPKTINMEKAEEKIIASLGDKFKGFAYIGEDHRKTKEALNEYLQGCVLSYGEANVSKNPDPFLVGKLRKFDANFKATLDRVMGADNQEGITIQSEGQAPIEDKVKEVSSINENSPKPQEENQSKKTKENREEVFEYDE